jgi:cytoskeletal protein CcmA (bactofilin family)
MAASKSHSAESVLADGVVVTGRITGDGNLDIRGRVEGEVDIRGDLTLTGMAKASLSGVRVTISGAVVGDITASEAIVLEESARVVGNLRAPRIAVALGAQIRGELDMGAIEGERSSARAVSAPRAARGPITPAKPVVVTRKNPPPAAAPAAKKAPPEPVVPAIKKGAKAAKKRA